MPGVKMLPGKPGTRFLHMKDEVQRQLAVNPEFMPILVFAQLPEPGASGTGVVVELGNGVGAASERRQLLRREREIEDIDDLVGKVLRLPGIAVVHWQVAGGISELSPGGVGGAETIDAVCVIDHRDRRICVFRHLGHQ